jgi:hypothetical protein
MVGLLFRSVGHSAVFAGSVAERAASTTGTKAFTCVVAPVALASHSTYTLDLEQFVRGQVVTLRGEASDPGAFRRRARDNYAQRIPGRKR